MEEALISMISGPFASDRWYQGVVDTRVQGRHQTAGESLLARGDCLIYVLSAIFDKDTILRATLWIKIESNFED